MRTHPPQEEILQAHPGAEETEQHENSEAGWERESQLSHNLGPTTAAAAS